MAQIVNLTPHPITLIPWRDEDETVTIQPSGTIARVESESESLTGLDLPGGAEIHLVHTEYGEIIDLPAPGTDPVFRPIYIVSSFVLDAVCQHQSHREDVFAPAELVRDDDGRIVGCRALRGTYAWVAKWRRIRHQKRQTAAHNRAVAEVRAGQSDSRKPIIGED